MISVKHLKKVYNEGKENEYMALQDISMQIQKGEINTDAYFGLYGYL